MNKPLSLYIHIPFCKSKCHYCDFTSFAGFQSFDEARYLDFLDQEISLFLRAYPCLLSERPIETAFVGGGTPTALSDQHFDRLLAILEEHFSLRHRSSAIEYTIEANPKTITESKALSMKRFGVNRVSLGLQSSNENELRLLGRIHRFADAEESVALLRRIGPDNINLDLMYAIPGQTKASFQQSLQDAVSLSPAHISAYSLILEEGTPLYESYHKGVLTLPSEEEDLAMYEMGIDFLSSHGYRQYEISNYAKNGRQCRHNIVYWQSGEYISFGLSAHSHLNGVRYANTADMDEYLLLIQNEKLPVVEREVLTKEMIFEEKIFLGLRMNQGIRLPEINQQFDIDFLNRYQSVLQRLYEQELILYDQDRLRLTRKGFELSNYVFEQILIER